MIRTLATIGAAALLAGCGSTAADNATATADTPAATPTASASETTLDAYELADIAAAMDCADYQRSDTTELFVAESGMCTDPDIGTLSIKRFGTAEAMANYFDVASAFGLTEDSCVVDGLVAVCPV